MKTILLLLLSALACFGQAFTFNDPAFVGNLNTTSVGTAFVDPSSISGLHAWYSPDTNAGVATYCFTDAGVTHCYDFDTWGANILVAQWNDRSGNNRHASYGSAVQPYCLGATNPPCIGFWHGEPGPDQYVTTADFAGVTNGFVGFFAFKTPPLTATYRVLMDGGTNDANYPSVDWRPTGVANPATLGLYAGTTLDQWLVTPTVLSEYTWYVASFQFAGAASWIRVNGTNKANGEIYFGQPNRWRIGGRHETITGVGWGGLIGDCFFYSTTNLTISQVHSNEMWLTNKYKIANYSP